MKGKRKNKKNKKTKHSKTKKEQDRKEQGGTEAIVKRWGLNGFVVYLSSPINI